jgi:hypothetical protein
MSPFQSVSIFFLSFDNGMEGHMDTMIHGETFAAMAPEQRAGTGRAVWAGRIMGGLAAAFLTFDAVGKLLKVEPVMEGTVQLGYPTSTVFGLGVTLLICVLAYILPRTSVLGAVLLTGYLGGAVATHVRVENPLFTHVLFPTYVAALLWGSLLLRDRRLHVILPWRTQNAGR